MRLPSVCWFPLGTTTDDAHLFGQNEFRLRAIAHKIAAKAVEQHLAGKKTRVAKLS